MVPAVQVVRGCDARKASKAETKRDVRVFWVRREAKGDEAFVARVRAKILENTKEAFSFPRRARVIRMEGRLLRGCLCETMRTWFESVAGAGMTGVGDAPGSSSRWRSW